MRVLIDTHYLLWMFMDVSKLSDEVKKALIDEKNEIGK